MRNLTKESRLNSRAYQFAKLIEAGYLQETYKELDFFTHDGDNYFTLKVFKGTGANHIEYMNYRTAERRTQVIQSYKNNYESSLKFKAEQKEKNKGKLSSHAGAAAAIKAELQTAFPGVKFSVKSDSYSMGDSVHISWEDGPTCKQVDELSCKYQYGSFNSMEDMYEHTNSRDDIPQTKYVSSSRTQSETVKALLPQFVAIFCGTDSTDWHNKPESVFNRVFYKSSLPANYTDLQIIRTDCRAGSFEDFYQFSFTCPETTAQHAAAPQFKEVETKAGEINIVAYSDKAIVVTGDTKPIKDKLKELGGSFNPRLSCGAGWVFPKRKLAEITKALQEEPETLQNEIQKTVQFFEETDIKIYGEVTEQTKVIKMIQSPVKEYGNIQDITEAANNGEIISLLNLCNIVNNV